MDIATVTQVLGQCFAQKLAAVSASCRLEADESGQLTDVGCWPLCHNAESVDVCLVRCGTVVARVVDCGSESVDVCLVRCGTVVASFNETRLMRLSDGEA